MEYIGDQLCLWYEEFVPNFSTSDNFYNLKKRGDITVHGRRGNGRTVFIEFESAREDIKEEIKKHYGDPYQYASKQPILNSVHPDPKAEAYYTSYVLPNGDKLPNTALDLQGKPQINYVDRYTKNAEWLNMIIRLTGDKQALKRELNIPMMSFWKTVTDVMKCEKVHLPKSRRHLSATIKAYKKDGYEVLIVDKDKFGNDRSKKVKDELGEALLFQMLSKGHDDTIVAAAYNHWAVENNHATITPPTVGYWRKKWKVKLEFGRKGIGSLNSLASKKIKGKRPSAPLLLIESDDNNMDAFFRTETNDWYRPALYVVIDTHNDYILGYAWGDTITKEVVREAYRNAHRHVMHLTGDAYAWQEVKTDRWGISSKGKTELQDFYESTTEVYIPAGLHNPNGKYIEQSFGVIWHQKMRVVMSGHYSGHNIDSKKKINRDNLKPAFFPPISEADKKIEQFIWAMRNTKRKGCEMTRHEEWVTNFNNSEKSKKKLFTTEQRLQVFGKVHTHTNTIKSDGVTPVLLGEKRFYELSQQQIFDHVGKEVQVYYDEYDLSQVLITDGKGLRLVLNEFNEMPRALADYEPGDRARLNRLLEEKKTLAPMVMDTIAKHQAVLERAKIDAESRLMSGVTTKEIAYQDTKLLTSGSSSKQGASTQKHAQNTPEVVGVDAPNKGLNEAKKPLKPIKKTLTSIYDNF
ncbi:MAG: hypothetical protein RIC03_06800 [Cyclobacteriaceae bacterium]